MNKGSGDLRARFYLSKFPTCKKEIKKILEQVAMEHIFSPSTGKVEPGGSLGLSGLLPGQPSFVDKGQIVKM